MKFLVDAQLPRRFCTWIAAAGHEAKHTLDLPLRNRTTDNDIVDIAVREDRIVVTKDDDFVQSFLVNARPPRLLLVATGNTSNPELEKLMHSNLGAIVNAFESHRFIELGKDLIAIREWPFCRALAQISLREDVITIYPVHLNPNVQEPVFRILGEVQIIHLIQPLDYLPFIYLMSKSWMIITDSGGIQEEAPSLGKPPPPLKQATQPLSERLTGCTL